MDGIVVFSNPRWIPIEGINSAALGRDVSEVESAAKDLQRKNYMGHLLQRTHGYSLIRGL